MDSQKQQAADRIKEANSILVTVSTNPSVDQLAACIGLTLALNKLGKHATAVFSGAVPSTIEFLQPEQTLEKNTDSLRDFIIALDKSKADKLRYKVEDKVVKIFITPYKTSINEKDLDFSQGDFNVDVIVALGVHSQADLDQVITAHGRILHDATVITVNVRPGGDDLGGINWLDPAASSLSELATELISTLDKKILDGQISTALLTGIVAATERFSNVQTSPQTMSISAELMSAGADQQLVAAKLEPVAPPTPEEPVPMSINETAQLPQESPTDQPKADDGTLEITHESPSETPSVAEEQDTYEAPEPSRPEPIAEPVLSPMPEVALPEPAPAPESQLSPYVPGEPETPEPVVIAPQIHIDEHGSLSPLEDTLPPLAPESSEPPAIIRHHEDMPIQEPVAGSGTADAGQGYLTLPSEPRESTYGVNEDDEGPSGGAPGSAGFIIGEHAPGQGTESAVPAQTVESNAAVFEPQAAPVITPTQPTTQPLVGDSGVLEPVPAPPMVPPAIPAPAPGETLSDIERDVHSIHADVTPPAAEQPVPAELPAVPQLQPLVAPAPMDGMEPDLVLPASEQASSTAIPPENAALEQARQAVAQAISETTDTTTMPAPVVVAPSTPAQVGTSPTFAVDPTQQPQPVGPVVYDPNSPPPVPPPMMPPTSSY